jgi:hypothetical protein
MVEKAELNPDYAGSEELTTYRINLLDTPKKTRIGRCFIVGPKEWINKETQQKEWYVGLYIVWTTKRYRDIKVTGELIGGDSTIMNLRDYTIKRAEELTKVERFSVLLESIELI